MQRKLFTKDEASTILKPQGIFKFMAGTTVTPEKLEQLQDQQGQIILKDLKTFKKHVDWRQYVKTIHDFRSMETLDQDFIAFSKYEQIELQFDILFNQFEDDWRRFGDSLTSNKIDIQKNLCWMTHFVDDEHFSALGIFRFYERKEAKNCWILYDKYEKSPSIPPPHRMLI